jgi:argininosuccinate lyase
VYGDLISLLTIMKSLPLTYNRDLQEDKPALFDAVNTTRESLHVLSLMLPELRFNRQRMLEAAGDGFLTATDLADYLAARGTPFRTAHEIVGRIVSFCIRSGRQLHELSLTELKKFSPGIEADALPRLDPETSVRSRSAAGATGKKPVAAALRKAGARIKKQSRFLESAKKLIP